MDPDRHARAKELFLGICDLPEQERPAALDRACGDDSELRHEVESLLEFHGETEVTDVRESAIEPATGRSEALPERVGGYRVLRRLGEGGMGVVYEVQQEHPVRRRLALKLVKWGMDTEEVLARFESERQALAMMSHPNVAQVFEAGATEQGRPYFTMEYIEGEPLTVYGDRHRLSTRERLELFVQVCDGVQHAHQKGIIHRDIKSSNVLVRIRDGRPTPTIIDFGIAKATRQRLTEKSIYTERGMLIGTPEYMSPEQAELSGLDVDTRTDVYSLGVLLYELLVGALPFDSKTMRDAGFDEIRRRIREEEPSKPSVKVTTLGATAPDVAARRGTDPSNLRRELSGDLDWITMKALEKDRARRFASPAEMAADITRHLRHEPVLAGPPSASYRFGKFVRRHRLGAAAGAAVAVALIVGFGMATVGLIRARRAESVARHEAATANKTSELLIGMFDDMNRGVPGHVMTPEQLLERGIARIEDELATEPVLQAHLLGVLGGALASVGRQERGRELIERSVAQLREHAPPEDPYLASGIYVLGEMAASIGDLERAQHLEEEALEMMKRTLGPNRVSIDLGRVYQSLGSVRMRQGELREGRSYLDSSQEILEQCSGSFCVHLANTLLWQAILDSEGDLDHEAALPRLERALAILESEFGPDDGQLGRVLFWLGQIHYRLGDREQARAYYERGLRLQESLGGTDSFFGAMLTTGLGELLVEAGELEEARERLESALMAFRKSGATASWEGAWCVGCVAAVYRRTGEFDRARPLLEQSLHDQELAMGPEHPQLTRTLHDLGLLEFQAGNLEAARRWYRRALERQEKIWGSRHYVNTWALYQLARIASREGDRQRALDLLRRASDCGYDRDDLFADPDLASLRGSPEYEEVAGEVRRRRATR